MTLVSASFKPGIFKEASDLGAGKNMSWADGNLVRFWRGQPQPIGGWTLQNLRHSGDLKDNPFTTTNASSIVDVFNVNHGVSEGISVRFSGASAFNSVDMDGTFIVTSVTDAHNFKVESNQTASASGAGGGTGITFNYDGAGFKGTPRNAVDWTAIDGNKYIGVGTESKIYIVSGTNTYDITPVRASGSLGTDPFTTVNASSLVTVNDTSHGVTIGTYVRLGSVAGANAATVFNSVDMNGEFIVDSVTDVDNFVVESGQTASAAGAGGGTTPSYAYDINAGSKDAIAGFGWGADAWGSSTWGTAATTAVDLLFPRTWAIPNWGEDLIINAKGNGIYLWDKSAGLTTRATIISGAPTTAQFVLTSPHTRHMIAFGAHDGSADDPLFIRWCHQNDYTDWTASETNTAGDERIDVGSTIIGAINAASGDIGVFTDDAMYIMQYIGPPFVWATHLVGTSAGIIGPHAAATWGDFIWYMGYENFFIYDGRVRILPCDVESHVFDNLNIEQRDKFYASVNREWQEIVFFYCSANSVEIDKYAAYNWSDNAWSIGDLPRTVFMDRSEIFQAPYAFDSNGNLYTHEDTTTPPSGVYLESGAIELGEGDQLMFINKLIPDFERNDGTVNCYIKTKKYPNSSTETTKGPFALLSTTEKINMRARGRQTKIRFESDGVDWRLSTFKMNAKPDGRN